MDGGGKLGNELALETEQTLATLASSKQADKQGQ